MDEFSITRQDMSAIPPHILVPADRIHLIHGFIRGRQPRFVEI